MIRSPYSLLGVFAFLGLVGACTLIVDGRQPETECLVDADCPTLDICDGPRVCDTMTHACVSANEPLDCDDQEPCTEDSCDPSMPDGCVHEFIDEDGDGVAPVTCTTDDFLGMGGDCADNNVTVNPNLPEQCDNGVDDNCNGVTDDDAAANITCYRDADGDGYHDETDSSSVGCSCAAGYISPNPGGADCADGVNSARPGQDGWFDYPYCVNTTTGFTKPATAQLNNHVCTNDANGPYVMSYDYNCDDAETQYLPYAHTTCACSDISTITPTIVGPTVISTFGVGGRNAPKLQFCSDRWNSGTTGVPACGAMGDLWDAAISCPAATTPATQSCR